MAILCYTRAKYRSREWQRLTDLGYATLYVEHGVARMFKEFTGKKNA